MKLRRKLLFLGGIFLAAISLTATSTEAEITSKTVYRTIFHNALLYDDKGHAKKVMYRVGKRILVDNNYIFIKSIPYLHLAGTNNYIKKTNVDGIPRTFKLHSRVYFLRKGRMIKTKQVRGGKNGDWQRQYDTTYGSSIKIRGIRYYKIGGKKFYNVNPYSKYYVRAKDVGQAYQKTVVTASDRNGETDIYDDTGKFVKKVKKGKKFVVDWRAVTYAMSDDDLYSTLNGGDDIDNIYNDRDCNVGSFHIKGTDLWIPAFEVNAKKLIPVDSAFYTQYNPYYSGPTVVFIYNKMVALYNADGTIKNKNGYRVYKQTQYGYPVKEALYIWVPSEKKAELFYQFMDEQDMSIRMRKGKSKKTHYLHMKGYVKAKDVALYGRLTPSNTPQEAIKIAKKQGLYNGK